MLVAPALFPESTKAIVKKRYLIPGLLIACAVLAVVTLGPRRVYTAVVQRMRGMKTVEDVLAQYGSAARARMQGPFREAGVDYPPPAVVLIGLKQERRLELWAGEPFRHVTDYAILGAGGTRGPKLREGDGQVPEGLYRIECLNPNSLFHLSLRLDYPNAFDRLKAEIDGRGDPGGDIMIHGGTSSIGCLAMGDEAAEDLFVLAADTGIEKISVVLSPLDMRVHGMPTGGEGWIPELYRMIYKEMKR
jgi:hypothetical protein